MCYYSSIVKLCIRHRKLHHNSYLYHISVSVEFRTKINFLVPYENDYMTYFNHVNIYIVLLPS